MGEDDGLADLHDSRGSESQTIDTVIEWAQKAVDATAAGIFLLHAKGKLETVAPTSPAVEKAHDLQLELGEGSCLEVIKDGSVDAIIIGDIATDLRFPKWGPRVAELGLRSAISVVLETREKRLGSLNVYSSEPHAFDRDDLAVITIFSHRAARAMAVAQESAGLTTALDSKLIGQAQASSWNVYASTRTAPSSTSSGNLRAGTSSFAPSPSG